MKRERWLGYIKDYDGGTLMECAIDTTVADFGVVADIADGVSVLRLGDLVESGGAREVLGNPQHDYTRMLLQAVPR